MAARQTVAVANEDEVISNGVVNPPEAGTSNAFNSRIWFSTTGRDAPLTSLSTSRNRNWPHHSQRRGLGSGRRLWSIQSQWRDIKDQHGQWTCFFCCHVCTGTIIIGLWHMLLHLLALSLIAVVMVHPELLKLVRKDGYEGEHLDIYPEGMQDVQAVNCSKTPCLLAAKGNGRLADAHHEFPFALGNLLSTHRLNTDDVNVALFITLCTFIVTLLMVHGAFRGQPSHLMPFFFLQVFDFCISCMTMIGYLSYLPNMKQIIHQIPSLPFQQHLLGMNKKCLTFFIMLIFIASFLVKAYCINIVWRCYKYLMQRAQGGPWSVHPRIGHSGPVDQESQTLVMGPDLPDYDTAITDPQYRKKASALYPEPPPSYDLAMAAFLSQEGRQEAILAQIQGEPSPPQDAPENILLLPSPPVPRHDEDEYANADAPREAGAGASSSHAVAAGP